MTANIWIRQESETWETTSLLDETYVVRGDPAALSIFVPDQDIPDAVAEIHPINSGRSPSRILLTCTTTPVFVCGREANPMRVLRDRDSIWWPGVSPIFFSTEKLAKIEPSTLEGDSCLCPRCHLPIEINQLIVQCPGCGIWHHQDKSLERECWSYDEVCGSCRKHPTHLDGEFLWRPDAA